MSITQAFRSIACRQVVHRLVSQTRHLDIQQRHIDMLAATVMIPMRKRCENRHGRVKPGQNVRQRHADFHRPGTIITFWSPRQTHQAAQALDHEVITRALGVRTRLTKSGDRAVDQIRIGLFERLIIQSISRQTTDLEVLDQDV
ncbi:hypothetical protein D3C84_837330 [compost metagenome]